MMDDWEAELKSRLMPPGVELPRGKTAAVALTLRKHLGELEVLLIERVVREGDPWSGQIALPGGMRGLRDPTLSETARRETLEEVALDVSAACVPLGRLREIRPANAPQLAVIPFIYSLRRDVPLKAGQEVKSFFWAPLRRLMESKVTTEVHTSKHQLVVSAYRYEDRIVWGLTYRILTAFFETVQELGAGRANLS